MINKKGLSDIIATVLIVLLALAAIAIVWAFIQPTIRGGGEQIDVARKCLDAEVKPTACSAGTPTGTVTVQLLRGAPDGILAVVEHADGTTDVGTTTTIPNLLGTTPISVANIASANTAKVAAQFFNEQGILQTCELSSAVVVCA